MHKAEHGIYNGMDVSLICSAIIGDNAPTKRAKKQIIPVALALKSVLKTSEMYIKTYENTIQTDGLPKKMEINAWTTSMFSYSDKEGLIYVTNNKQDDSKVQQDAIMVVFFLSNLSTTRKINI